MVSKKDPLRVSRDSLGLFGEEPGGAFAESKERSPNGAAEKARRRRRRAQSEGMLRQRLDGRWEGRISLGWRDGKRLRRSYYGGTQAEVIEKAGQSAQRLPAWTAGRE